MNNYPTLRTVYMTAAQVDAIVAMIEQQRTEARAEVQRLTDLLDRFGRD